MQEATREEREIHALSTQGGRSSFICSSISVFAKVLWHMWHARSYHPIHDITNAGMPVIRKSLVKGFCRKDF